jgi:hypothetical protein
MCAFIKMQFDREEVDDFSDDDEDGDAPPLYRAEHSSFHSSAAISRTTTATNHQREIKSTNLTAAYPYLQTELPSESKHQSQAFNSVSGAVTTQHEDRSLSSLPRIQPQHSQRQRQQQQQQQLQQQLRQRQQQQQQQKQQQQQQQWQQQQRQHQLQSGIHPDPSILATKLPKIMGTKRLFNQPIEKVRQRREQDDEYFGGGSKMVWSKPQPHPLLQHAGTARKLHKAMLSHGFQ